MISWSRTLQFCCETFVRLPNTRRVIHKRYYESRVHVERQRRILNYFSELVLTWSRAQCACWDLAINTYNRSKDCLVDTLHRMQKKGFLFWKLLDYRSTSTIRHELPAALAVYLSSMLKSSHWSTITYFRYLWLHLARTDRGHARCLCHKTSRNTRTRRYEHERVCSGQLMERIITMVYAPI